MTQFAIGFAPEVARRRGRHRYDKHDQQRRNKLSRRSWVHRSAKLGHTSCGGPVDRWEKFVARVTLRQLEYFVAAAETQSVSAAAARVYLSQSAVSTALAELEENLGVQLFIRHARGLTLTTVGQTILAESRQLLGKVDDLENNAAELRGSFTGRLSVGCYTTLAPLLLPRVIDAYLTSYPSVDLNFMVGSHPELQAKLRDGRCDVALLYDYGFATDLFTTNLEKVTLQSIPPHALFSSEDPLGEQSAVSLSELSDQPLVLYDLPPGGEYFKSLFTSQGMTPNVRFRTTEFELVRALVARRLGYSILTQHTEIDVSYENLPLITRPLVESGPGLDVVAAHLGGSTLTRRATAFIEECERSLGSRPA